MENDPEVGMENKDASPARYLLKIDSFSLLSDNGIDKYESSEFESSGHKWKMIIYPNGDGAGRDHISVFLAIVGTSSLLEEWEVNATFSFLIYNQIHDNYVIMRGMERRFRNIKTEWGLSKFISHATFKAPSNGYLVNDKCIIGVDVYVMKNHRVGEYMSLSNVVKPYTHKWKISEFTKLNNELFSEQFIVGSYKWQLLLYPTGSDSSQSFQNISIYLVSVDAKGFDCRKRVHAKFSITVKDQISGAHSKIMTTWGSSWFAAGQHTWGWAEFMALSEFKDLKKGFLVKDRCIVEAQVSVLRVVDGFT